MGRPLLAVALHVPRARRTFDLGPVDGLAAGKGRVFEAGKPGVAVFRTRDGEVYATDARCPRGGESLSEARVAARVILCPAHGYAFKLKTGACIGGGSPSLRTYATRLSQDGHILVEIDGEGHVDS